MNCTATFSFPHRTRQRGVVLIVALLVMVVTILAAVALIRTVDVATLISGNLAYRQAAVQAADSGVEAARNWVMTQPLDNLNTPQGTSYYATWDGGIAGPIMAFNPATFDWTDNSTIVTDVPDTSTTVQWVVHRMCQDVGDPAAPNTNCFTSKTITTGGNSNRIKEPGDFLCNPAGTNLCGNAVNPFYRISVRVTGPRGTVSYAQAVIY